MSDDERRRILEQVAAGELSPDEGAHRLHALDQGSPEAAEGTPEDHAAGDRPEGGPARTIRVEASAATVRIVGDPDVAEAVAEGRYTMRRDGDVLVVETELPFDEWAEQASYVVQFGGRHSRRGMRFRGSPFVPPVPLAVRMNPELPLEVVVNAGRLRIRGVRGPISCDVAAGTVRIDGFRGPLDCTVHAGSLAARGRLTGGDSELNCDAGSMRVDLEPDSSVELDVSVTLGRADVEGFERDRHSGRWTLGGGAGRLRLRGNLGSVKVRTLE